MAPSFVAGVILAETASQLALCGLLIGRFFIARKARVSDKVALAAAATVGITAVISVFVAFALERPELLSSCLGGAVFAASVAALVVVIALNFRVSWPSFVEKYRTLGIAVVVSAVFGLFCYVSPFQASARSGTGLSLSLAGRILLGCVSVALACSMALMRRASVKLQVPEFFSGAAPVLLLTVTDSLGVAACDGCAPNVSHAGFFWAIAFGISSLKSWRGELEKAESNAREVVLAREELRASHAAIERMQRELGTKKQLAAVGELAAAIAHEVRNPLAIIMNAVAGLRRPTLQSTDRSTLLGILDEETARLNRLVTDLLRFARPVIIKRSSVSILELAKRVEGRLADNHALSVDVPDEPSLRVVQADANLLRLVFDNLVSNAFQAMPDGGRVRVVVSGEQRGSVPYVRIDIIDHGHGMDEQVLERATDPFYTTRPSGTGLGLPIVQRIVEAHGGSIEIESAVGHGTKVSMLLPRLAPSDDGNLNAQGMLG